MPIKTVNKLAAAHDPAEWAREAFALMGNDTPEINGNRVLCAVYIEPDFVPMKGPGGEMVKFHKTDTQKQESIWQSKTMMVLAVGNAAFVDTNEYSHYGFKVKPGDWVTARITNCTQAEFKTMPCRIIQDYLIETKVHDPRIVTS